MGTPAGRTPWPVVASSAPPTSRTTAPANAPRSSSISRYRGVASPSCSTTSSASATIPLFSLSTIDRQQTVDPIGEAGAARRPRRGPEFTGRDIENWAHEHGVRLFFIGPGKPMQNGSIESFNGGAPEAARRLGVGSRFRGECLDPHWFRSLDEARRIIERWRMAYNVTRPHTALPMPTSKAFAAARPFERPRQAATAPELSGGSPPEPLAALSTPVLSQTGRFHL